MAAHFVIHPSVDDLRAFALGKLNDSTAAALMNHLDGCADCCKTVAALSSDDFLDRLRQAHSQSSTPTPSKAHSETAVGSKPSSRPAIANLPSELANNPQYEILRELGRGGMGVVYLAKNKLMDRFEVLKVINKMLLDHPGAVERFLREIRSAAKLSHANVVGAYSALQMGELLAFAMEYVEGQDLASLIKSQGPLPVPHACFYVQQAALGLQHAFEKGMVHRDIKPQNLILAREGKKHIVKVLDFGLAKVIREKTDDTGLTGEGKMLGTPDYIAPEQTLDAAKADIRADIYSLGCTLYYLLSGHPPFSASSLGAILVAHQMHEAKPLNLERPEVPEELAAVVRKMMAKSPAQRYQTPREVVQALAPFVKQGTTPNVSPVNPLPASVEQNPKPQSEPVDVWGSLTESSSASIAPNKSEMIRKPRAATVRERTAKKKWLIGSGVGLLLALLSMLAAGVFKVKTKDGTLVLENLPSNSEVLVDEERATVIWGDGGKKAEIRVKPGTHKVEVKKDGLLVEGRELTLKDGGSEIFRVRLLPNNPDITEKREAKASAPIPDKSPLPPDTKKPEAPRVASDAGNDKGFLPLFNGKDLSGWKTQPKWEGDWHVEKGALIWSSSNRSELRTEREDFKDCHLRAELRISDRQYAQFFVRDYVIALNSTNGNSRKTGSLFAPSCGWRIVSKSLPPAQWFTLEVIAKGNHIIVKVNGQTTADYVDPAPRFVHGHLTLAAAGHGGERRGFLAFRKIEIKDLK